MEELDLGQEMRPRVGVDVHRESPPARNEVDELAVAAREVEDGVGRADEATEEVLAEDAPDALFRRLLRRREACAVELLDVGDGGRQGRAGSGACTGR